MPVSSLDPRNAEIHRSNFDGVVLKQKFWEQKKMMLRLSPRHSLSCISFIHMSFSFISRRRTCIIPLSERVLNLMNGGLHILNTDENVADLLTKPLSGPKRVRFVRMVLHHIFPEGD
jgi:hypothetical protein